MIELENLNIVNYCHSSCVPLKNIMRLSEKRAYDLAYEMANNNENSKAFGRFADFQKYYPERMKTDKLLYEQFLELGGKPQNEHPLSFVLQGSNLLHNWFDKGRIYTIPLIQIPSEYVSFTLW